MGSSQIRVASHTATMLASLPIIFILVASSLQMADSLQSPSLSSRRLLVSGYSQTLANYALRTDEETILVETQTWNVGEQYMSWIEPSNDTNTFYVAHEMWPGSYDGISGGAVSRWKISEDGSSVSRLEWVSLGTSLGSNLPVHLVISHQHRLIYAANYGGSSLSALTLGSRGEVGGVSIQVDFPLAGDQCRDSPHPHQTLVHGDKVWVVDLGCDMIRHFHYKDGTLEVMGKVMLESGTGPRHMVLHPHKELVFLVCELSNIVQVYRLQDTAEGGMELLQQLELSSDTDGTNYGAEILIGGPGNRYVYVSSRGDQGRLVVYTLQEEDRLVRSQEVILAGTWPRSIALHGEYLLALDQKGEGMEVFQVDQYTGKLSWRGWSQTPGQAACVQIING